MKNSLISIPIFAAIALIVYLCIALYRSKKKNKELVQSHMKDTDGVERLTEDEKEFLRTYNDSI